MGGVSVRGVHDTGVVQPQCLRIRVCVRLCFGVNLSGD